MTQDTDDKLNGHLRADLRGMVDMLANELTEDGYEYDADTLDQLETEARAIADHADELAHRYRIAEAEAEAEAEEDP
jgi:hypothetical protein